MKYPLGSFPRFGHQQRWADERRFRAMVNSIATRQANAERHLHKEIALHEILTQLLNSMEFKTPEGQNELNMWKDALGSIRRRHESGKRAYYGKFIEILLFFCDAAGTYPELKEMSKEDHKCLIEDLAERHLRGEKVLFKTQDSDQE